MSVLHKLWRKFVRLILKPFKKKRVYGFKKSKDDIRDYKFKASVAVPVPPSVDLSSGFMPAYDQGKLGSCTANAIGAAIQFDQLKQDPKDVFMPSRLFIYYLEREMEGTINLDNGAAIRDGIKVVNTYGVCKEELCPYVIEKFREKPSQEAYVEAKLHKSIEYTTIDNRVINDMKACLAGGFPFVFGMMVYESLESFTVARTGIMPMPKPYEQCMGGHAVICIGYDDAKQAFLVRNSWGTKWGINGNFWVPYQYMTSNKVMDCWTIKSITDYDN